MESEEFINKHPDWEKKTPLIENQLPEIGFTRDMMDVILRKGGKPTPLLDSVDESIETFKLSINELSIHELEKTYDEFTSNFNQNYDIYIFSKQKEIIEAALKKNWRTIKWGRKSTQVQQVIVKKYREKK